MDDGGQRRGLFTGVTALAAMAMGGNLPYRRLCREYGADLTCSEMILAHKLVKGGDRPLLRHHGTETTFGVQLAGKSPEVMADATAIAVEHGAVFIDLNFGCPIDLVVKRGMGAALLKRPARLASVVAAVRAATDLPLSVKLRAGWSEKKINAVEVARLAVDAGADAVGVHGRTRAQRYTRNADWDLIDRVARGIDAPVLGNGDLLTPWDLAARRRETSVRSFLVARGALTKPWIFRELSEGQPWRPTVAERWVVMRRYCEFASEYFGEDEKGQSRVRRFFLWHLGFWHRWRPYTEEDFRTAWPDSLLQRREERVTGDPEAELLASGDEADHEVIWRRLLDRDHPGV